MKALTQGIKHFLREDEGVTMVEYGLIAALISIVVLVALTGVGTSLKLAFQTICNSLKTATGSAAVCV